MARGRDSVRQASVAVLHEAARLRLLFEGLAVQLVTTPRRTSARWALAMLDEHLAVDTYAPPARV